MNAVRIIGMGSPHGADRAAWLAIEALKHRGLERRYPRADVSLHRCAGPHELLLLLGDCRLAILIDALEAPGTGIRRVDLEDIEPAGRALSSHATGIVEAVTLIRRLRSVPLEIRVLGIAACEPDRPFSEDALMTPLIKEINTAISRSDL